MSELISSSKTGGRFLVESITGPHIFSRELFSEEHKEIEELVRDFASDRIRSNKSELDNFNKELSLQILKEMGELGLLGVDIPEEYGGIDLDKITSAIVVESLSLGSCGSFTTTFSVQTGIGSLPIAWFGTREQKKKYLPKMVKGEWVGAYGLTEPSAGSDALSCITQAVLNEDGKYYILNGEKIFTTNGGWADVFIVFAKVDGEKFSAFIVDKNTQGFTTGTEEKKMGMKGSSTTSLIFKDARVPAKNLLFEEGKGATIAFNALNLGRLKLAAADLGGCKALIEEAVNYATDRRQFGQPIIHFDVIKGKIADMVVGTFSSDSMIYRTIGLIQDEINSINRGIDDYYIHMGEAMERYAIEASMAKVYGSEVYGQISDQAVQILGGYGFIEEYPVAGAYRDARIDRIWEGTNEINRQIITGHMVKKALTEDLPIRVSIRKIDSFLTNNPKYSLFGSLADEAAILETGKRLALTLFHDALCEYGQDLRHEQQLMEIMANIFIALYTAESTITRVHQINMSDPEKIIPVNIAKVFTAEMSIKLLNLALTGMNGIYKGNLPSKVISRLREFQVRMLPKIDIIRLKRSIAEFVYSRQAYPF
jgi:alkylation response protein AidB-like acyl-CoA dehydrogenase